MYGPNGTPFDDSAVGDVAVVENESEVKTIGVSGASRVDDDKIGGGESLFANVPTPAPAPSANPSTDNNSRFSNGSRRKTRERGFSFERSERFSINF